MHQTCPWFRHKRYLLLDFDGPVCRVFANHPASTVAAELRQLLADEGVSLPEAIIAESDPLEILRYSATAGRPGVTRRIEDALRAAELVAVGGAEPTPYAGEVIGAAHRVAIVSNNSAEAVRAYLTAHGLAGSVHAVIGRPYAEPARMKPNPWPVLAALRELGAQPEECVLVGDSTTDIDAAHAARVPAIGYANKPGKRARLARADALIDSMAELATY
ncbi:HAD family hydrolase [Phytohabitans rumicis]|uniref:HAD family hydrolase n=1 Tax=Phytohabitans rumicis TaxID=1076125 RepID=UPI001FE91387|nr:HAD-IA family hydrolase [Phytohabitans rumicis]